MTLWSGEPSPTGAPFLSPHPEHEVDHYRSFNYPFAYYAFMSLKLTPSLLHTNAFAKILQLASKSRRFSTLVSNFVSATNRVPAATKPVDPLFASFSHYRKKKSISHR
jgi:hypothetical protein